MSVASIFNFKVDLIELILVLDLNPALAIVSGSRESARALAKLGFETVIAILSEAEILGSGFFCRRGLYGFCLRRCFRLDLSLLLPRPRLSLLDNNGWGYSCSSSEAL